MKKRSHTILLQNECICEKQSEAMWRKAWWSLCFTLWEASTWSWCVCTKVSSASNIFNLSHTPKQDPYVVGQRAFLTVLLSTVCGEGPLIFSKNMTILNKKHSLMINLRRVSSMYIRGHYSGPVDSFRSSGLSGASAQDEGRCTCWTCASGVCVGGTGQEREESRDGRSGASAGCWDRSRCPRGG